MWMTVFVRLFRGSLREMIGTACSFMGTGAGVLVLGKAP